MKSSRNVTDDFIRIVAIVFVIVIHEWNYPWAGIPFLDALLTTVVGFCNGFFYMLSGKYNLNRNFSKPSDYALFYKKKIVDIVFPYVLVSFLLSAWNLFLIPDLDMGSTPVPIYYIKFSLLELFSRNNSTHLWYMFGLMGYLLSAPFLSKMFHAMGDSELHVLFGVALLWSFVKVLLFPFVGKDFYYYGWFLSGWIIHFCVGHYIDRISSKKSARNFYAAGIVALLINVLGMTFAPDRFKNPTDLAPSFVIACMGALVLLEQTVRIRSERLSHAVSFVAKHVFLMYLVHYNIIYNVAQPIAKNLPEGIRYVADIVLTFAISFVVAIVLNYVIITPCKRALKKALAI